MRHALIAALVCVGSQAAYATSVQERSLDDLVADSDHVLIGKVVKVDVVNKWGFQVTGPKARTRPGSGNTMRLHVVFEDDGILKTNRTKIPRKLMISLWRAWWYSLDGMKYVEGQRCIFLLKGRDFRQTYPQAYRRHMSEQAAIEALIPGGRPLDARLVGGLERSLSVGNVVAVLGLVLFVGGLFCVIYTTVRRHKRPRILRGFTPGTVIGVAASVAWLGVLMFVVGRYVAVL